MSGRRDFGPGAPYEADGRRRKATFGGASSLDDHLTRPDRSVDGLNRSEEEAAVRADSWKTIDIVLTGRKSCEVGLCQTEGGGYPCVTSYAFSRTLKAIPEGGMTLVSDDAAGFVRELKRRDGKGICPMGAASRRAGSSRPG